MQNEIVVSLLVQSFTFQLKKQLSYIYKFTVFVYAAKCNLGYVNPESMHPAVFPTNLHAGQPHSFALPCAYESAVYKWQGILQLVSQVGGFPLLPLPIVLRSNLGVERFLTPLFRVPPLSKYLVEVESFLSLVPAHRVIMETSLLCLILAWGPHQPFTAPVPKLIYWQ